MKRRMSAVVLLCAALSALPAKAADGGWPSWTSWWRNADQRGEKLLQEGDAAAAATVFTDPQRKAYAKIMAGDYRQAARDLSAFDDGDAHYNRGNALAHAGKLQEALQAYDLALKRDPDSADARHNRDLVANALKQQSLEKQSSGDGEKSPQDGNDRGQQGTQQGDRQGSEQGASARRPGQQGKADGQAGKSADGKGPEQPSPQDAQQPGKEQSSASSLAKNATPSGTGKGSEHTGQDQPADDMRLPGDARAQHGKRQEGAQGDSRRSPASAQAPSQQADTAAQARRDAAASLAQSSAGHAEADAAAIGKDPAARGESPATLPASEQQLAQEQWLRSIPDDPGGLLRRKFLVEHLLRQQKSQP